MWLTYEEAAKALKIKADSVRRQARLRNWNRRTGNDGKVQVEIPEDRLADNPPEVTPQDPPPDQSGQTEALEIRLQAAEKRAEELSQDRDRWREMAEALRADLATERSVDRSWFSRLFGR